MLPTKEKAHGTATALKQALSEKLARDYPRAPRRIRRGISSHLLSVLESDGEMLTPEERASLRRTLQRFAGSAPANMLLNDVERLRGERKELRRLINNVPPSLSAEEGAIEQDEEQALRLTTAVAALCNKSWIGIQPEIWSSL